jgi:hypothetical protein
MRSALFCANKTRLNMDKIKTIMAKFISNSVSCILKLLLIMLLLFNTQTAKSYWPEDWLYVPERGLVFDYSYVMTTKGTEIYPLSFGAKYIWGWDYIGVSVGAIGGGSWKKKMPQFNYQLNNYEYNIMSNQYYLLTAGLEFGFTAIQIGLGTSYLECMKESDFQYVDGVYKREIDVYVGCPFLIEPSLYFYIPIDDPIKLALKIGYQITPKAAIMNALTIGGGILL